MGDESERSFVNNYQRNTIEMSRSSKLLSLSRKLRFPIKSFFQYELRPILNFKMTSNYRLDSHIQTLTSVRLCSSMFSHGNTDKVDENSCLDLVFYEKVSGEHWKILLIPSTHC